MTEVVLNLRTFGFIVGTRVSLGIGIGLLIAERIAAERRRVVGAALVAIGAAATIPAAMAVLRSRRPRQESVSAIGYDSQLIGLTRFARKGDDVF